MMELGIGDYYRLSLGSRRRVDDWLEITGLFPRRVVAVRVEDEGGLSVLVTLLSTNPDDGGIVVTEGGDAATELQRAEVTVPFPIEVLAELRR